MQKNPIATITLENGKSVTLELYPDKAPNTVNNFISLANSGFYDGLCFHRRHCGIYDPGRRPCGQRHGRTRIFHCGEFRMNGFAANDLKHARGVISMARSMMPDSAGSQFFIMHENSSHLDGQYAAFGKVTDGMDAIDEIAGVRTRPSR